ncbi:HNH endonuclease family protein [Neoaquamicrobium sediminum]|uniref:DUF262 domain-containing protein n=1 Tax=Neoaquamicrobium sediminum TaxID=1849104 RepID=A0ABV3WS13_9HYPH
MATNTVNLDALILRADFATDTDQTGGNPRGDISLTDLDRGFFSSDLRKPDFQRETTHWSPQKVLDLLRAFIDGDLIPAVILWQRGREIFVIDGAHRLSALIAWLRDDYGDRAASLQFFGSQIPPEQQAIAERTRKLVNKNIGPYSRFKGLADVQDVGDEDRRIMSALGRNSLVVQWVPAKDAQSAEASFFKINQAAQPIDPTERRILQSRHAANAIAARCIVRGGKGHKYWSKFSSDAQAEIQTLGEELYDALFKPPLTDPVSTLDMPVAGRGYNQLPFAFDLTNLCNNVPLPERSDTIRVEGPLHSDMDGAQTIEFLKAVRRRVQLITTKESKSLGLHPAVYFYAMSGTFMPNAFLATAEFAKRLGESKRFDEFTRVRGIFEDYLFENKIFISLTVTKLGSGARSLGRLSELFWRVFEGFSVGHSCADVSETLYNDPDFNYLVQAKQPPPRTDRGKTGRMSGSTKSAVMMREGYAKAMRCGICGAAVHFRSQTVDHIQRRSEGGAADMKNGQIVHPYCNSGFKA